MSSASPFDGDAAPDVIEQARGGVPPWLGVTAMAAVAAVACVMVVHAAVPAHRIRPATPKVTSVAWPGRLCPAIPGRPCWPREPFAGVECLLPAAGASANGPTEALLVRRTHRVSVDLKAACR